MNKDDLLLAAASKSILFFVRRILGAEPTKQQLQVLLAIDQGAKKIAIKSGHGTGKSSLLSWIVLYAVLFHEDCKVPMTAPAAPQLTEILIPEVRKWHAKLPKELAELIEVRKEKVVNKESGSFAVARTARKDNPDALQGFHATHIFFLIDEASGVPREIYEVAEGALTGDNSFAIMTGNPTRTEGYFYDAFHKNSWQWTTFTFNAEKSENVSPRTIEEYKRKYGRDSDVYRVRVLGEFPKEAGDSVFVLADIEDAIVREKGYYDDSGPEVWGLDIGGNSTDSDASVLVKRKGYHFYEIKKFHNLDLEELAERLKIEYAVARRKPVAIFTDETGMGKSFPAMAQRRGLEMVYGVNFSRISHELYFDNRTKLYYTLKSVIPNAKLPDNDEMLGDLMAQSFEIRPDGKIKLLDKKTHIIPKLGRSPDVGDAMALTCEAEYYLLSESDEYEHESYGEEEYQTTIGGAVW